MEATEQQEQFITHLSTQFDVDEDVLFTTIIDAGIFHVSNQLNDMRKAIMLNSQPFSPKLRKEIRKNAALIGKADQLIRKQR